MPCFLPPSLLSFPLLCPSRVHAQAPPPRLPLDSLTLLALLQVKKLCHNSFPSLGTETCRVFLPTLSLYFLLFFIPAQPGFVRKRLLPRLPPAPHMARGQRLPPRRSAGSGGIQRTVGPPPPPVPPRLHPLCQRSETYRISSDPLKKTHFQWIRIHSHRAPRELPAPCSLLPAPAFSRLLPPARGRAGPQNCLCAPVFVCCCCRAGDSSGWGVGVRSRAPEVNHSAVLYILEINATGI